MNEAFKMFLSFFKIGAFTFGGGYAMIPIIEAEVVDKQKWISKDDFMDALVIAQSLPGALAVNFSTFVGYKISGLKGAILALLGTILPSFLIIIAIAALFAGFRSNYYVNLGFLGINAAVPMLVLIAVLSLAKSLERSKSNIIIVLVATIALTVFKVHPIILIILGALYGILFCKKKGEDKE